MPCARIVLPDWSKVIAIVWYINITGWITKEKTCVNMPYVCNVLLDWAKCFRMSHMGIYLITLV